MTTPPTVWGELEESCFQVVLRSFAAQLLDETEMYNNALIHAGYQQTCRGHVIIGIHG